MSYCGRQNRLDDLQKIDLIYCQLKSWMVRNKTTALAWIVSRGYSPSRTDCSSVGPPETTVSARKSAPV